VFKRTTIHEGYEREEEKGKKCTPTTHKTKEEQNGHPAI
jgi:hypothetical protein